LERKLDYDKKKLMLKHEADHLDAIEKAEKEAEQDNQSEDTKVPIVIEKKPFVMPDPPYFIEKDIDPQFDFKFNKFLISILKFRKRAEKLAHKFNKKSNLLYVSPKSLKKKTFDSLTGSKKKRYSLKARLKKKRKMEFFNSLRIQFMDYKALRSFNLQKS